MAFRIDERLAADTLALWDWPLCAVLLMNDRRFPWLILVPRREGLRDLHDLDAIDRDACAVEMEQASRLLQRVSGAEKMNVAALGNLVPQLHIHVIARFARDAAWPRPVWGVGAAEAYAESDAAGLRVRLEAARPDLE
jgi:diadenosine tetraphosphate (Ap4A) HIT family hydrolase